jgi:CHAD domain-containing protein
MTRPVQDARPSPESSFDDALRALLADQVDVVYALHGSPDAESVHKARIALRRAAVLLRIVEKRVPDAKPLRRKLQREVRRLASARDATVRDELLGTTTHERRALARLGPVWTSADWRQLVAAFSAFVRAEWAGEPDTREASEAARERIRRRRRELTDTLSSKAALDGSETERHEARKELRRLRYLYEAFEPLLSEKARKRGRGIHKLEARLGRLRDLDLACAAAPPALRKTLNAERKKLRRKISNDWKI